MSAKIQKQNLPLRLEAQLWSASLPTRHDSGRWKRRQGSRWTPKAGALDCVSSAMPPSVFFRLDTGHCRHRRDDDSFMGTVWSGKV